MYTYNAYNQRTKKVAGGNTTHYVYGPGGVLLGEYDNSGALIREYIYANGEPLAQIDAGSPETILYLHTDHLLTARYATNAGGSSVWTWDSGAFGVEAPTGSATVNLRFPGQYYDSETGLHYNWHRYYDPATGRYITSDPLGLAAGLNTYGYAAQNPLSFYDPDGQILPALGGVAVAGSIITGILWAITAYNNWDRIADAWDKGTWCELARDLGPEMLLDAIAGYTIGLGVNAIGARVSTAIGAGIAKGIGPRATKWVKDFIGDETGSINLGGPARAREPSSRAARRATMREQGIPTSQQPTTQSFDESGRVLEYDIPKPGGGTQKKTVQQQTKDRSHPNEPHWESGSPKTDPNTGDIIPNKHGRPKIANPKSKAYY